MEKAKFQIKGMHCTSCSTLIEDQLNKQEGVVMSKVNHESGKAVVVYDKGKISQTKISRLIERAGDGDYKVELQKARKEVSSDVDVEQYEEVSSGAIWGNSFFVGFLTGVSIVSVIFNVILLVILFSN